MKFTAILLGILLLACQKPEERTCFKPEGEPASRIEYPGNPVKVVELYDDLHLVFVPDSITFLEVRGGINMLNQVDIKLQDSVLALRNSSKCYFLRKFKHEVTVYLHGPDFNQLELFGFGRVTSEGTLVKEKFNINSWNSAAIVDLQLDAQNLYCGIHSGAADIKLKGRVKAADLYSASYGVINGLELEMENTYVDMKGSGDCKVNTVNHLYGHVKGSGNLLYMGSPLIEVALTGEGIVKPVN